MPYVDPRDALENVVVFNMRKQNVDAIPETHTNNIYHLADPKIKDYIKIHKQEPHFLFVARPLYTQ